MSELGPFGYGQQQPEDYGSDAAVIGFIARQIDGQNVTAKVVKVVGVHPGTGSPPAAGTVDVLPLVKQIDGNGFAVAHETVFGLRVLRLAAGPWAIVADPSIGDVGIIVCMDRDSSSVTDGTAVTPASRRRFSISDGVYIGGILGGSPQASIQLKADGTLDIKDKSGNELASSASGWTLTGNLAVTGNVAATGTVIAGQGGADQVGLQTHTHPITTAPGTSGAPTPGT